VLAEDPKTVGDLVEREQRLFRHHDPKSRRHNELLAARCHIDRLNPPARDVGIGAACRQRGPWPAAAVKCGRVSSAVSEPVHEPPEEPALSG
jgi:hypothetical protein